MVIKATTADKANMDTKETVTLIMTQALEAMATLSAEGSANLASAESFEDSSDTVDSADPVAFASSTTSTA